ncbi:hypothetical protein ACSSS7_001475 [Eimeria intestinalis]
MVSVRATGCGGPEGPLSSLPPSPSSGLACLLEGGDAVASAPAAAAEAADAEAPHPRQVVRACCHQADAAEEAWATLDESWAQQTSGIAQHRQPEEQEEREEQQEQEKKDQQQRQRAHLAGGVETAESAAAAAATADTALAAAAASAAREASVAAAAAATAADAALETASAAQAAAQAAAEAEAALESPKAGALLRAQSDAATETLGAGIRGDSEGFQAVFVFTNPTSGGNKAAAFTKTAVSRLTLTEPHRVKVFIYDIRDGLSGSKPGFLLLKAMANKLGPPPKGAPEAPGGSRAPREGPNGGGPGSPPKQNTIRILVAGGDGTVMWCVDEMRKTGVDSNACAVGVVPYGTAATAGGATAAARAAAATAANDSSYSTSGAVFLRRLVDHCMHANVMYHDLWSVNVVLKPEGFFTRINSITRQKEVVVRHGQPVKELAFTMSNYFSMGVESRIGRGFDKHRTKSQALNKMRYGLEGFKKTFVTRTKAINHLVQCLTLSPGTPEERMIFTTDKMEAKEKKVPLLRKTATLVALNIPSFSGGNDIWAPSKKLAMSFPDKQQLQAAQVRGNEEVLSDGVDSEVYVDVYGLVGAPRGAFICENFHQGAPVGAPIRDSYCCGSWDGGLVWIWAATKSPSKCFVLGAFDRGAPNKEAPSRGASN